MKNIDQVITLNLKSAYEQQTAVKPLTSESERSPFNVAPPFNNEDEERIYYEMILQNDPQSSYACQGLGDIFLRNQEYQSAKVMLEWSVVNNPENKNAVNSLRKANLFLGLQADDNTLLIKQKTLIDSDVETLLAEASELIKEKNYHDALFKVEACEGIFNGHLTKPDNKEFAASFFNLKGYILLGLNDIVGAKELYERALNLNPGSSTACTGLAEILLLEGLERAKTMYEWGVKYNPSNFLAIQGLKKVNLLLGLPDNDIQNSSTEQEGEPDIVELLNKTYSLFEQNKFREALDTLTIAEKFLPENDMKLRSAIESLRGFSYLGLKELQDAKHFFERALYDEPDSSDACAGLGEVFHLTGFDKEAKTMFEWAVQYNPGNKFARQGLSKVNQALGFDNFHNTLVNELINA